MKYLNLHSTISFIALFAFACFANAEPQKTPPLWIDQAMDEVIAPVKKWLDNDPEQPIKTEQATSAHSIRSAIKQALTQHQGVVLNAQKHSTHYNIKILSDSGKIKVIRVEHALNSNQESEQ